MMKRLRLYHRHGCHLCEEMWSHLESLRPQADFECDQIDVDGDEALKIRFHDRVPVLVGEEGTLLSEVFLDPTTVLNYLRDA